MVDIIIMNLRVITSSRRVTLSDNKISDLDFRRVKNVNFILFLKVHPHTNFNDVGVPLTDSEN